MRILDRYAVRQLVPVWVWCLVVFIFLSCVIDLFEHLDEILRYHINTKILLTYYANFTPFVFVKASPLALLLSAAFVASRLSRHQEFLAMNASGTSLLRASVPFLFVGWLASLIVFLVNDLVVPKTSVVYEEIQQEYFKGIGKVETLESVAVTDNFNRLYHANRLNLKTHELSNLTILEHDLHNHPIKSLFTPRAIYTQHGWLLLSGTIYRVGLKGTLLGDPESFVERLISYPVTPESFRRPQMNPETMRFGQLRLLITRLKQIGLTNVRRYAVELWSKLTLPLMNLIVCFLAFAGSTQPQLRGNLRGLGLSLAWGLLYYIGVGFGEGAAKKGLLLLPVVIGVWAPHAFAVWWGLKKLRRTS